MTVPFLCVAYATGDRFRYVHALACLIRRRSRSSVPAQTPWSPGSLSAYSRHGRRTGHGSHTALAASSASRLVGNHQFAPGRTALPRHAALRCHEGRSPRIETSGQVPTSPGGECLRGALEVVSAGKVNPSGRVKSSGKSSPFERVKVLVGVAQVLLKSSARGVGAAWRPLATSFTGRGLDLRRPLVLRGR